MRTGVVGGISVSCDAGGGVTVFSFDADGVASDTVVHAAADVTAHDNVAL